MSVYDLLEKDLDDNLGPTEINSWKDIVSYLDQRGLLDYDVLKEILLEEDEEE